MPKESFILPIIFALVLSGGFPLAWRYWKRRLARNWPLAPAIVIEGKLGWRESGSQSPRYPQIEVAFSYTVQGSEFGGYYEEVFMKLEEAQKVLKSIEAGPLFVRFNPNNPADNIVRPLRGRCAVIEPAATPTRCLRWRLISDKMNLGQPWALYLALCIACVLAGGIPVLVRRWKIQLSRNWPLAVGVFVDGTVSCSQLTQYRYPRVEIKFSYSVEGIHFDGRYEEGFNTFDEATHMLDNLKSLPIFVRFDPRDPRKYLLDPYQDVIPQRQVACLKS